MSKLKGQTAPAGQDFVRKPTRYRWIVLAVAAITYFMGSADRANLAVALPYIKADFDLTNTQAGLAAGIYFFGITLFQIPASFMIQRMNLRIVMMASIILTSVTTMLTGLAQNTMQLLGARVLLGVAEAPLPVGGVTTLNRWFPHRERGTAVGIFVASFKVAPAVVPPIAALIIYHFGWREVFYFFAAPGLLVAALWLLVANTPRDSKMTNDAEASYIEDELRSDPAGADSEVVATNKSGSFPLIDRLIRARRTEMISSNSEVLKSRYIWCCALGYALMSVLTNSIVTWVPTYLVEVKGYSLLGMGALASAPWVGAVVGGLAGGITSDSLFNGRRKPVMMVTSGFSIITMYGLMSAPNDPFMLAGLLFLTGFMLNFGYPTFTIYPMGMVEKKQVPFATSLFTTLGAAFGGLAPLVIGIILDNFSWSAAFLFLSICAVGSFALVISIIEPMGPSYRRPE